ncbi:MAG: hypothetical protein Q8L13_00925 [Bradyrhizobium sp.]|uniref:hypothetical protein n=1 Tax=Bradyrhizobium sp. TaxID=376 RepID=UPI002730240F|nr:hypothetical protein [Bradyrhizobium sp.]MDP1864889.1 hypothetical protein [Bradyrhizobium sp.]
MAFWKWYDRASRVDFAGTILGWIFDWKGWVVAIVGGSGGGVTFLTAAIRGRDPLDVWVLALVVAAALMFIVWVIILLLEKRRRPNEAPVLDTNEGTRVSAPIEPDLNAADGFNAVMQRSQRVHDLARTPEQLRPGWYESHMSEPEWIQGRIKEQIDQEIHDALRLGKIIAWGRIKHDHPLRPIEPKEWDDIELVFDSRTLTSVKPNVCAQRRKRNVRLGGDIVYVLVHFSRRQLLSLFPLQDSGLAGPRSLRDFFQSDFPALMKMHTELIFGEADAQDKIAAQGYMDFDSHSLFVGFFVPRSPRTMDVCTALSDWPQRMIDHFNNQIDVEKREPGSPSSTRMRDLTPSKRVYLYHEDSLSLQQHAEIERAYQAKGLFVFFRGPDYLSTQWTLKSGTS